MFRLFLFLVLPLLIPQSLLALKLSSPDFRNRSYMPEHLSCLKQNISPELHITDVPEDCKTLVLIMEDPDVSGKIVVHWLLYNLNANTKVIPKGKHIGKLGLNDFKKRKYMGPCPSKGTHRYLFNIYALDVSLPIAGSITKEKILRLMKGHILEKAELIGLFKKEEEKR
jgi:Raf kinase inhibitor-like YbhB/YbcL family protein